MRRAKELLSEELLQQASAALVSDPPAEVTPAVVDEMRLKHPAERPGEGDRISQLPKVSSAAALQVKPEQLEAAIRSFNRGSGAGPSGLRPQHLKDALVPGWQDELLRQVTQLANLLLSGSALAEVQPWLCGATLTALPKPTGDLRPVAVGEVWRRLTSKVAARTATDELRPHFEPIQLGVGSKGGCESIVHVARQWLQRNRTNPDKVLVTIDLSNAFNSVDRSAFLTEARRLCHDLVPWLDFCYGKASHLFLGPERLNSARGIQQGDPLGPLLFSAAIHDAVLQAKAETNGRYPGELDWIAFFLDDGTAAGTSQAAQHFVVNLLNALATKGLHANLGKCEVIPAAGEAGLNACQKFPGWKHVPTGCFKLLGAPLGTAVFCSNTVATRITKARGLLEKVAGYSDPQGAMHLLRYCASWSKVQYACRTIPPSFITDTLGELDKTIRTTVGDVAGKPLPDHSWGIAQLPLAKGGLGIRSPSRHCAAAYLGSIRATVELCHQVDSCFDPADAEGGSQLQQALSQLQGACLPAAPIQQVTTADLTLLGSQKSMSSQVDACALEALSTDHRTPGCIPRHLALAAVPGAGTWLTAPAVQDERQIDEPLYRISVQRRLRVPIFHGNEVCTFCGAAMDRFGDHALTCLCGGDRVVRHNAIRDQLYAELRTGGARVEREKAGLLPGRPSEDGLPSPAQARRPADVWLAGSDAQGAQAIDFAVTSGLRSPCLGATDGDIASVFADYEDHKRAYKDTDAQCRRQGLTFVPFIVDAHAGGLSPLARRTVDSCAKEVAATLHLQPAAVALRITQRISCSLQRESARAVLRRRAAGCNPVAPAAGWDAVPVELTSWQ